MCEQIGAWLRCVAVNDAWSTMIERLCTENDAGRH